MRHPLVVLLFGVGCGALVAQQPVALRNGQQVTLRGTLTMEPAGRLQFVTVKTAAAYAPIVPGDDRREHPAETVHEVGLSGYNRYDLLYAHRGQQVTVTGSVMTDGASPYYFHATSLKASSIRLANGAELIGRPRARPRIAVDVGQYAATVLLPANLAAPWQYSAQGSPDAEHQFLSCSSNGGGDVVNCFCGEGFHAMDATMSSSGADGARVFSDSGTAQFAVGDAARALQLKVTCSR